MIDKITFIMPKPPVNIEDMNSLLGQCSLGNFHPLKKQTVLADEEKEKPELDFSSFVQMIAYPIQSYHMTQPEKLVLFQHCRRLFPDEMGEENILKKIFKRIVCEPQVPIGLDLIKPKENPPPSLPVRILLGEQLSFENPEGKMAIGISGGNTMLRIPLEQRQQEIARLWNPSRATLSMDIKELHYSLNLLYFECEFIRSIWSLCEAAEAAESVGRELFPIYPHVRVSGSLCASTLTPTHDFETVEGITFAIQYDQILEKWRAAIKKFYQLFLLKNTSSSESKALSIYLNFKKLSTELNNPACKKLELIFRKELFFRFNSLRFEKIDNILSQYFNNKSFNLALEEMDGIGEDSIAPFNCLMSKLIREHSVSVLNNIANFCATESFASEQQFTDFKALCVGYRDHFQAQKKLYESLFEQLSTKVKSKKNQLEYRKFFNKLFSFEKGGDGRLPPTLPEFSLPEFDPTLGLFEMLSQRQIEIESSIHSKASFAIVEDAAPARKVANRRELKKAVIPKKRGGKHLEAVDEVDSESEDKETTFALPQPHFGFPSSKPIFSYAPRVERWFHSSDPLDRSSFHEYQEVTEVYFEKMKQLHGFSQTVDRYVKELALKSKWINRRTKHHDTNYILPGQMQVGGETKRGVFVYCLDKDDILYHRFFSEKSPEDFIDKIVQKTFLDIDFPELESVADCEINPHIRKADTFSSNDEEITSHPILGIVTITNRITRSTISLFPVQPCF